MDKTRYLFLIVGTGCLPRAEAVLKARAELEDHKDKKEVANCLV